MQAYDPDGTRMEPHIPCVDTWPPGTITEASMHAYKRLEKQGEIRLQSVAQNRSTGVVTVRYLADCPQQWILDRLRKARQEIIQELSEQVKI